MRSSQGRPAAAGAGTVLRDSPGPQGPGDTARPHWLPQDQHVVYGSDRLRREREKLFLVPGSISQVPLPAAQQDVPRPVTHLARRVWVPAEVKDTGQRRSGDRKSVV